MSNLDELWQTSTGLPLDGATVTVVGSTFGFNDFMPGRTCWNATFLNEEDGQTYDQSFTVGKDGKPSRDQNELLEPPKKLSRRSNYGRIVHCALDLIDHPGAVLGSPYLASGWLGTRWVLGTVDEEGMNPDTKESKIRSVLILRQYLGKVELPVGNGQVQQKVQYGAPAPSANPLWNELVTFARDGGFADHDEFMEAALEKFPDAEKDAALRKAIYTDKAGSIWASR